MPRIELEHTFDAGHRIVGHKGKCARLHGHTYRAQVSVAGTLIEPGFVIDYGDIKDVLNEWDHRFLLWKEDPLIVGKVEPVTPEGVSGPSMVGDWLDEKETEVGVVRLDFNPTAENMARYLADEILERHLHVRSVSVRLWETPKSNAYADAIRMIV